MNFCLHINNLIVKGVIRCDSNNHYVMTDELQIPHIFNKPFIELVHNLKPAPTNYNILTTIESSKNYYNSDAEENYAHVTPAEHAPKRNKKARKE